MRSKEEIDELNRLRKEVDRLSRQQQQLEKDNALLRLRISKYEPKVPEESGEITHSNKLRLLTTLCRYGFGHFCDGTPNRSEGVQDYLATCPDYEYCTIRQKHVYKPKGEE